MKKVQDNIDTGNQSGKYGELNALFQLVQAIQADIDTYEEEVLKFDYVEME